MKTALAFLLLSVSSQYSSGSSANTLRIELFDGKRKCVGQDLAEGTLAVFKIGAYSSSAEGHSQALLVTVKTYHQYNSIYSICLAISPHNDFMNVDF